MASFRERFRNELGKSTNSEQPRDTGKEKQTETATGGSFRERFRMALNNGSIGTNTSANTGREDLGKFQGEAGAEDKRRARAKHDLIGSEVDVDYINGYLDDHWSYWSGYGSGEWVTDEKENILGAKRENIDRWLDDSLAAGTIDQEWYDEVMGILGQADTNYTIVKMPELNAFYTDFNNWFSSLGAGETLTPEQIAPYQEQAQQWAKWANENREALGEETYTAIMRDMSNIQTWIYEADREWKKTAEQDGGRSFFAGLMVPPGQEEAAPQENFMYTSGFEPAAQNTPDYQRMMHRGMVPMDNTEDVAAVEELIYTTMPYTWEEAERQGYSREGFDYINGLRQTIAGKYDITFSTTPEGAADNKGALEELLDELNSGGVVSYAPSSDPEDNIYGRAMDMVQGGIDQANRQAGWWMKYGDMSYYDLQLAIDRAEDPAEKAWLQQYAPTRMTDTDYGVEAGKLNTQIANKEDELDELRRQYNRAQKDPLNWLPGQMAGLEAQIKALEEEIMGLRRQKGQLEQDRQWATLHQNEDWSEMSKLEQTGPTSEGMPFGSGTYTYDYINYLDGTPEDHDTEWELGNTSQKMRLLDFMTDDERQRYNYIYNTQGTKRAEEYLKYLEPSLSQRSSQARMEDMRRLTQTAPVAANILSVGGSLIGGLGYLDVGAQKLWQGMTGEYKPINYYGTLMQPTLLSRTAQKTTAQMITDATGTIQLDEKEHPILAPILNGRGLADVYQLGMSAIDSKVAAMTGNPYLATALLAGSAATNGVLDALEHGATDEQALQMGMWNGVFEALFEFAEVDNLLKGDPSWIKAVANQAITEGLGEGFTSVANNLADFLIMADKSELERTVAELMAEDPELSEKEAYRKALVAMAVGIGWDIVGGAVSGGISAGGQSVMSNYSRNMSAGLYVQENQAEDQLMQLAADMAGQGGYTGKLSEYTQAGAKSTRDIGRLYNEVGRVVDRQNMDQLAKALVKQGLSKTEATTLASAIGLDINGIELTAKQRKLMDRYQDSEKVQAAVAEVLGSDSYRRRSEGVIGLRNATRTKQEAPGQETMKSESTGASTETAAYEVSGDGRDHLISDPGRSISVQEIASVEDGKVMLRLEDGSTVDAEDVSFGDESDALIYWAVADMGVNASAANVLMDAYRTGGDVSASDYAMGIQEAYWYGRNNIPFREIGTGSAASALTEHQRKTAYRLGELFGGRKTAKEEATVRKTKDNAKADAKRSDETGKVHFDRKGRTFNDVRETALKTMEQISKALGIEFYIYESYVNDDGKRVYRDASGKEVSAPNGFYDPKDGSIHIDLNAGNNGKGVMLFTIAHELTHFIRQWSPAKFRVLANFLMKQYGEKGVSVSELVDRQIAKAKANGRTIDRDTAYEEVVADSMEAMLADGNVVQMMADLKQQDKTLWEKIRDWFRDLAEDLKKLVAAYKDVEPETAEGRMVADMQDVIVVLESLYAEALVDAGERYRASGGNKKTTREGGEKMQIREIGNSGRFYVQADRQVITGDDPSLWGKQIERYINEQIRKEQDIALPTSDGHILLLTARSAYKLTDRHLSSIEKKVEALLPDDEYALKGRIATHIDELISVARFTGYAPDKLGKHENDIGEDGFNYFVSYFRDADGKYYQVPLSSGINELEETAYSIGKPRQRSFPAGTGSSSKKEALKGGRKASGDIIYSSEAKSQEVKTAIQLAYEKALGEKADGGELRSDRSGVEMTREQQINSPQFKAWFGNSKIVNADGSPKVMYHGSQAKFDAFDRKKARSSGTFGRGFYFTDSTSHAGTYGNLYAVYLSIQNPLEHGRSSVTKDQVRKFLEAVAENEDYSIENYGTYDIGKILRGVMSGKSKVDAFQVIQDINVTAIGDMVEAVELFNEVNGTDYDGIVTDTETVAFQPTQIKSATDNVGTFDKQNPNIYFSDRDPTAAATAEALEKQNEKLKQDVAELRRMLGMQGKLTRGTEFRRSSIEAAVKSLTQTAGATLDGDARKELYELLRDFYKFIASEKELTWEGVTEEAGKIADFLQSHVKIKPEMSDYARDVLREIRGQKITLDDKQMAEVEHLYGSYEAFRKTAFGSVTFVKQGGISLDSFWHEMASMFPGTFDDNLPSNDQPQAILDAVHDMRSSDTNVQEYAYNREFIRQDLIQAVYDSYWKVDNLHTVADKKQKEINEIRAKHRQQMEELRAGRDETVRELREQRQEDIRRVRQEYRERTEKKVQDVRDRYEASREKAADDRRRAAMRQGIRKTIRELEKLLVRGGKKRNVKEGMQDLVATALASAEVLFTDSYTVNDMIRSGVGVVLKEEESKLLNEAMDILAELDNAPAVVDEAAFAQWLEKEAVLKRRLSEIKRKLKGVFERERIRLEGITVSTLLQDLADAYAGLTEAEESYIRDAFDENVYEHLLELKKGLGYASVKDMRLDQLEALYDAYRMVLTTVRNANKLFDKNVKETRQELANKVILEERIAARNKPKTAAGREISKFMWNNLKPVYAFERIGSQTLARLYGNIRKGQDTWAKDMKEADTFRREIQEKYGFNSWDLDKSYTFTTGAGKEVELTLGQIMSVYAYTRRAQAHDHILKGGFVLDGSTTTTVNKLGIKVQMLKEDATAYKMSPETLAEIIGTLDEAQTGYVEEMQRYLSETMGEKGNSVSMKLYGIRLFKEANYFPLRSASQYMARAKEADLKKEQGQTNLASSGFTKAVAPKASNPVVLSDFMGVWAGHVNEMSMYHGFVLPMEDFRRVYNYSTPNLEDQDSESVNAAIQNAHGAAATAYIDQLYRDLNSGALSDSREGIAKAMVGKFKKAATVASLSVVFQQPSAIGRAFALIEPKHFEKLAVTRGVGRAVFNKKRHDKLWAELKRYAPVAMIKEMGYFDTGMGRSAVEFLQAKEYSGIREKAKAFFTDSGYRDELLTKPAAVADELTWVEIWQAVKNETADRHPDLNRSGEEFLKIAGDRFAEVIDRTQVYDSVLARSANMRSKSLYMNMATSFMAEPTTTLNMVWDALAKAGKGQKKAAARVIGSVAVSIVLNAALSSLVYAARDDDEDETYLEKYLASFLGSMLDGFNPLTYIPFLKDIWSLAQGYDVERADMSLMSDLMEVLQKLVKAYNEDTSGMTDEQRKEHDRKVAQAWWNAADVVANLFGIPLKNIRREINGAVNLYGTLWEDFSGRKTTWMSLGDALLEEIRGATPVWGWLPGETKAEKLLDAILAGDDAYVERIMGSYKDRATAEAAVKNVVKEAYLAGEVDKLTARQLIINYGGVDVTEAHWTLDEWDQKKQDPSGDADYSKYDRFYAAVETGTDIKAVIQEYVDNGVDMETLKRQISTYFKPIYTGMSASGRAELKGYLINAMELCGQDRAVAEASLKKWDFEAQTGYSWDDRGDAYKNGAISADGLIKAMMDISGKTREEAALQVEVYDWQKEIPNCEITAGGIKDYRENCEGLGISRSTFYTAWSFYMETNGEVDENGESIPYSKVEKVIPYIDSLPLTADQKTALARCWWGASTVNRYKTW